MLKRMPSLHSLQVFDAVARRMSFTRAAEDLRVTQGAVSYQIRQIEQQLGTTLFARVGRGIALTPAGESLCPALRRAIDEVHAAVQIVSRTAGSRLTISLTTYFASRWLLPRLAGFMGKYPKVEVRLIHSAAAVPPQVDDADIAIHWGRGDWPGGKAELLFGCRLAPVCARALVHGSRQIMKPAYLKRQTILHNDDMQVPWAEWLAAAGIDDAGMMEGPVILDPNVRMQAAIEGQGFALADALVAGDIAEGRLVAPFDVLLSGYGYYLTHGSDAMRPVVQAFREWLLAEGDAGPDSRNWIGPGRTAPQR